MFSNFNFPNSPLCCTCPCSHIHEPVNIYVSQFMYIQYMTSDRFLFRLHPGSSYSQSRFCSGQNISQSVRVYITRLLTCFVIDLFSFLEGLLLLFAASWLSRYLRYSLPLCIGSDPSFAIFAKVCFSVQSYGARTLHKKRFTLFGEI